MIIQNKFKLFSFIACLFIVYSAYCSNDKMIKTIEGVIDKFDVDTFKEEINKYKTITEEEKTKFLKYIQDKVDNIKSLGSLDGNHLQTFLAAVETFFGCTSIFLGLYGIRSVLLPFYKPRYDEWTYGSRAHRYLHGFDCFLESKSTIAGITVTDKQKRLLSFVGLFALGVVLTYCGRKKFKQEDYKITAFAKLIKLDQMKSILVNL